MKLPNRLFCFEIIFPIIIFSIVSLTGISEGNTTINFWAVTGSFEDVEMYNILAKDFESETGIAVKVTPLSWGNFNTKYFTSMAAGLPPDIGVTNLGGPMEYGSVGGLIDFEEEFPNEIEELKNRFYPKLLPQFTFEGKLFGFPADIVTLVIYYRTDIFDKLGISPPETWSQFHEVIQKLEAYGYHYGFGWTRGEQWALGLYTKPFGVDAYEKSSDGKVMINWLEPGYLKGVAYAMDLWYMHDLVDRKMIDKLIGMFKDDNPDNAIPIMVDLSLNDSRIPLLAPEINGKWNIIPWPKADDGVPYNIMGGTAYVIFKRSEKKKEAFEWLKYLNRTDVQQKMILHKLDRGDNSSFTISPVKDIWSPENADFWERPELQSSSRIQRTMSKVMDTFDSVYPLNGTMNASRLESALLDRIGTYITSELTRIGRAKGLNRWELIQEFAKGNYPDEKADLDKRIFTKIKEEYTKITPQATEILQKESDFYQERFGNIIQELNTYENKKDILFYMEVLAFISIIGLALIILIRKKLRKHIISYIFIGLPLILVILFVFIPAIVAFYLSFTAYHPVLPLSSARWTGVSQYIDIFSTGILPKSILRSALYVIGSLPIQLAISLVLAALLNNKLKGEKYWRFLYFSPMVTSMISISLIFTFLFQGSKGGWINAILLKLGLIDNMIIFLHDEKTFLPCVIVLSIWYGLAFNILILLGGLQQIPTQLYEAAEVDGASWLRKFFHISLPGIRPQIFFLLVMGLIWGFQVFEPIYMLGGGTGEAGTKFGPNDGGLTMVPLIFQTGFESFKMGQASAIAYVLFGIILFFTLVQMKFLKKKSLDQ